MPIRKAKSAFLFYQGDQLKVVRNEDPQLSMGDAMTLLSKRWKSMTEDEKAPYLQQEAEDLERFRLESAEADQAAAEQLEAKRAALQVQPGESHSSRGARQKIDQERQAKEDARRERKRQREANMDEDELEEREMQRQLQKRETEERRQRKLSEEKALQKQHHKIDREEAKRASQRLEYLLKQSSIFAKLQGGKQGEELPKSPVAAKNGNGRARSHHRDDHHENSNEEEEDEEEENKHVFLSKQPSCIKFGQLKPYQMEALNWMIHLSEKGLNGILADEMGLGKTLQSISILAYHYEYRRIQGPHLICVPKSTLSNWMNELQRWCPSLRAIKFHGSREEREYMVENLFNNKAAAHDGKRPPEDRPQIEGPNGEMIDDNSDNPRQWDVCVTTYEIANAEKRTLQKFAWKYLVIDEAHRLKNDASMFSMTVRSFRTVNRLLLTGTPLQNNLHELWALLNFLLPDIFGSAEMFDEWFNLEIDDEEAKKNMISQLHKILRPFMLRRLKVDVAKGLPPKTETILMVGMSKMQKQLYRKLLLRDLDSITGNITNKNRTAVLNIVMQLRKCCGHPYLFEGVEDRTLDPLGEHLVENCGKLSMVDKLLKRLKERGSRVLIFTQMTRVLDILEDFMVMRGYEYCRIDGNTDYDNREQSIDDFNREGSTKFCFLLSTRAGGLGINLQTADTCILYDSDWNPQQDLQAQDRCHRLGQKKPVSVFRLVSENTVEEKIVERAQQKLKLDAMVVQSGRLKEKDKVSKEEIMAAVRFGADTVFRSEESTITDEDIDTILERGIKKTQELNEKIKEREKGDLLDFRLDGGISAQTFEGVDYSDKDLRDQLRLLAADNMGKRDRRPPPTTYVPTVQEVKATSANAANIKLPKALRIPKMEDHQFFRRDRLKELDALEFDEYINRREIGDLPPREVMEQERTLLPPELAEEKRRLLSEGFSDWTRTMYFNFVKACAKCGRDDIKSIANDLDMPEDVIKPYSIAFWKYGESDLGEEWEKVYGIIERGEKKLEKQKKLTSLLSTFVGTFDNPREEMVFANKGTTHFALEQDRALLCAVDKLGYGNWDSIRENICMDSRLKFQHSVQGMTTAAITKRCDYRMRQMERELEAREKSMKNQRPAAVIAAQNILDCAKEMDKWEMQTREAILSGEEPPSQSRLSTGALKDSEERQQEKDAAINRLLGIEAQMKICLDVAEETRQAIYRGDQYVNYSNITLKAGGPASTKDEQVLQRIQDSIEVEKIINPMVLKIPSCGQCENCERYPRKLCTKRLEARKRFYEAEMKKISEQPRQKQIKKLKPEGAVIKQKPGPKPGSTPKKKRKLMMKKADGQLKIRVTSQGNKRMSIPDELFPDLCRRVSANGTSERARIITQFVEENPTISNRQVTIRMGEITTRDKPDCIAEAPAKKSGRSFVFYLRPMFYKFLPEDERPADWEKYAAEDEKLYEEEQRLEAEKTKSETDLSTPSKKSEVGSVATSTDIVMDDVDGDETEEEEEIISEPPLKKVKIAAS